MIDADSTSGYYERLARPDAPAPGRARASTLRTTSNGASPRAGSAGICPRSPSSGKLSTAPTRATSSRRFRPKVRAAAPCRWWSWRRELTTRTAASLVKRLFEAGIVNRVLFLFDRIALVGRPEDAFTDHLRDHPCHVLWPGGAFARAKFVTITTLQTVIAGYGDLPPGYFDLVITDECHRSIYGKWSGALLRLDCIHLGLTATPCTAAPAQFSLCVAICLADSRCPLPWFARPRLFLVPHRRSWHQSLSERDWGVESTEFRGCDPSP